MGLKIDGLIHNRINRLSDEEIFRAVVEYLDTYPEDAEKIYHLLQGILNILDNQMYRVR